MNDDEQIYVNPLATFLRTNVSEKAKMKSDKDNNENPNHINENNIRNNSLSNEPKPYSQSSKI